MEKDIRDRLFEITGRVVEEMDRAEKVLKSQGAIIGETLSRGKIRNMTNIDFETADDWGCTRFGRKAILRIKSPRDMEVPIRTKIIHGTGLLDSSCTYEFGTVDWKIFSGRRKGQLVFNNTGKIKFKINIVKPTEDAISDYEVRYDVMKPDFEIRCEAEKTDDIYKFSVENGWFFFHFNELTFEEELETHRRKIKISIIDEKNGTHIDFKAAVDGTGLLESGELNFNKKNKNWLFSNKTSLLISEDGSKTIERTFGTCERNQERSISDRIIDSVNSQFAMIILDFLFAFQNRAENIRLDMSSIDEAIWGIIPLLEDIKSTSPLAGLVNRIDEVLGVMKAREHTTDKMIRLTPE